MRKDSGRGKRRRPGLLAMASAALTLCIVVLIQNMATDRIAARNQTYRNALDFYCDVLKACGQTTKIYFEDIIPVEWDTMIVPKAYAHPKSKTAAAGYRYADYLSEQITEGEMNLIFKKGDWVVYYVDGLRPDTGIDCRLLENGLYEVFFGGASGKLDYKAQMDAEYMRDENKRVWYYIEPDRKVFAKAERPYLAVTMSPESHLRLTIETTQPGTAFPTSAFAN